MTDYVNINNPNGTDSPWENYGAVGTQISQYHKIWIIQDWPDKHVCVAGYLGEGTSREIVGNSDTPFADTSLASMFRMVNGVLQTGALPGDLGPPQRDLRYKSLATAGKYGPGISHTPLTLS